MHLPAYTGTDTNTGTTTTDTGIGSSNRVIKNV